MTEKVENNAVISDVSGTATAVPESSEVDNAVCTDIAARNEFDSTISTNDYDPDEWVRESDIGDRVRELRFTVEVE